MDVDFEGVFLASKGFHLSVFGFIHLSPMTAKSLVFTTHALYAPVLKREFVKKKVDGLFN